MDVKTYIEQLEAHKRIGVDYTDTPIGRFHVAYCLSKQQETMNPRSSDFEVLEMRIRHNLIRAFELLPR